MADITVFYSRPTGFTSPGNHAEALAGLPADLAALTEVVHGLIVHEHLTGMYGFELAQARRASVHIRTVARLLDQIIGEDGRPLDVAREHSGTVGKPTVPLSGRRLTTAPSSARVKGIGSDT